MATIRELITRLGYSVDDKNLKKYESSISNVKNSILSIQNIITGAVAYGFYRLVDSTIAYGEELKKSSQITGIAVDKLEKLRIGAGLAEMDVGSLNASLNIFSTNVANAMRGSKADVELFERLGINPKNIKSVDDGLSQVSERFSKMEDGIKKVALAGEIFGRGGGDLIPLLNNYKNMLGEYTDVINAFSMGSDRLKQFTEDSDDIGDRFQIMGILIKKLKIEFVAGLYPAIKKAQQAFLKFFMENKESIFKAIQVAVKGITIAFEVLGKVLEIAADYFSRVYKSLKWIWESKNKSGAAKFLAVMLGFAALPPVFKAVMFAAKLMFGAFGGWWGIAAMGIFGVIDDIIAYMNGEGSITGQIMKWIEDPSWDKLPEKFKITFDKIKNILQGFFDSFYNWFDNTLVGSALKDAVQSQIDMRKENQKRAFKQYIKTESEKARNREAVERLDEFLQMTGANEFQNIINNSNTNVIDSGTPAQMLQPPENNLDQQNTFNIEIKIDGSNPEMTPEKIGEEVNKGTQAAIDKLLRETSQAFPFTEPRFA